MWQGLGDGTKLCILQASEIGAARKDGGEGAGYGGAGQNVSLQRPAKASQICLLRCLRAEENGCHSHRLLPVLSKF